MAWNATARGRDLSLPAEQLPDAGGEIATVGMPDLKAGGVVGACATLFADPDGPGTAREQATRQLAYYADSPLFRITRTAAELDATDDALPVVVLMEGADPIVDPDDVRHWFDGGVRMVGLAWKATAHTGGTGAPGGLTDLGKRTVAALDDLGILHDASHLAEQALDELLDSTDQPVCASHSNCRAIVGADANGRHLPDRQINALLQRGGVIGTVLFDRFLLPHDQYRTRRATLADVVAHLKHVCDLAGNTEQAGLGTDLDGGIGQQSVPEEIKTAADLPKLADALADGGFTDGDIAHIMGQNWQRYFRAHLPTAP